MWQYNSDLFSDFVCLFVCFFVSFITNEKSENKLIRFTENLQILCRLVSLGIFYISGKFKIQEILA